MRNGRECRGIQPALASAVGGDARPCALGLEDAGHVAGAERRAAIGSECREHVERRVTRDDGQIGGIDAPIEQHRGARKEERRDGGDDGCRELQRWRHRTPPA